MSYLSLSIASIMLVVNGAIAPLAMLMWIASLFPLLFPYFLLALIAIFGNYLLRNYQRIAFRQPLFGLWGSDKTYMKLLWSPYPYCSANI